MCYIFKEILLHIKLISRNIQQVWVKLFYHTLVEKLCTYIHMFESVFKLSINYQSFI